MAWNPDIRLQGGVFAHLKKTGDRALNRQRPRVPCKQPPDTGIHSVGPDHKPGGHDLFPAFFQNGQLHTGILRLLCQGQEPLYGFKSGPGGHSLLQGKMIQIPALHHVAEGVPVFDQKGFAAGSGDLHPAAGAQHQTGNVVGK